MPFDKLTANEQRQRINETRQSHGIEEKTKTAVSCILIPAGHGGVLCQELEYCDVLVPTRVGCDGRNP